MTREIYSNNGAEDEIARIEKLYAEADTWFAGSQCALPKPMSEFGEALAIETIEVLSHPTQRAFNESCLKLVLNAVQIQNSQLEV